MLTQKKAGGVGFGLCLGSRDPDLIGVVSPARMQLRRSTVIQNIVKPFEQEKHEIKKRKKSPGRLRGEAILWLYQGVFSLSTRQ